MNLSRGLRYYVGGLFALLLLFLAMPTADGTSNTRLNSFQLSSLEAEGNLVEGYNYWDTDLGIYKKAISTNQLEEMVAPTGSMLTTADLTLLKSLNQVVSHRLYWNTETEIYETGISSSATETIDASSTRKTTSEIQEIDTNKTAVPNLLYWDRILKLYFLGQVDNTIGGITYQETCSDGLLNQDEVDIDCGGICGPCAINGITRWTLNEGTGTTFSSAGWGITGQLYGIGTGWGIGAEGQSLFFDGNTGSYASIIHYADQLPKESFSLEVWTRWDIPPANGNPFARIIDKDSTDGFSLQHNFTNDQISFHLKTNTAAATVTSNVNLFTPTKDVWNQVAVTYDGAALKMYVNGVFNGQISLQGEVNQLATAPIYLGGKSFDDVYSSYFGGSVDEMSIHNAVLTAQQISDNYSNMNLVAMETCSDGVQNQDETGIDCGGVCSACAAVNTITWNLDEGAGSTFDSVTNSAAGTLLGGYSWASGIDGQCAAFDGVTGSYASIVHHPEQLPQSGFSTEIWYQWDVTPGTGNGFARLVDKSGSNGYKLEHNYNNTELSFWLKTVTMGTAVSSGNFSPVQGTWYHVVNTYDGANLKMYINGVFKNSVGLTGNVTTAATDSLYLGGKSTMDWQSSYFQGKIDAFSVWNQTLTPTEVLDRYTAFTTP